MIITHDYDPDIWERTSYQNYRILCAGIRLGLGERHEAVDWIDFSFWMGA